MGHFKCPLRNDWTLTGLVNFVGGDVFGERFVDGLVEVGSVVGPKSCPGGEPAWPGNCLRRWQWRYNQWDGARRR